ncbi:MAG: bifunctional glycosyltransferase family 2/GtrA family protein [Butyrivibrio sp.]|nr:bifunctional glycosyltransferase family 2/GtrA family protein [Butyrivibrio sp.]
MQIKKIALIPAFEPDFTLINIVLELRDNDFEIVIVNDGSSQDCDYIFSACANVATVIDHPINIGKGVAIKTGLYHIKNNFSGPYVVVTVDADGQHAIKDVIKVCGEAEKNPASLILGSRKFDKDVPLRSRFGNTITRKVYKLFAGTAVYDTQTGLRAFSQSVLPRMLKIKGDRYEYEMNVLMYFAKEGRDIKEVWIETIYKDDNKSSHFDTVKDSIKIYKEILKFSASSLCSFSLDYVLYCMLNVATGSVIISNILARLVSATVNYNLNQKLVFRSDVPFWKSALGYAILAVSILAGNTIILNILVTFGLNIYLGKIITEIVMFTISYIVQRGVIFKRETLSYEKA